jgi:hypothetical protein
MKQHRTRSRKQRGRIHLYQQEWDCGDVSTPHGEEELLRSCHGGPCRHLLGQLAVRLCCSNQHASVVAINGQTPAIAFLPLANSQTLGLRRLEKATRAMNLREVA